MNKLDTQNTFASQRKTLAFVDTAEKAKESLDRDNAVQVDYTNVKGKGTMEEKEACAKKATFTVNNKTKMNYFIRQYASGVNKNEFYSPVNGVETDFSGICRTDNSDKYKWVKVSKHLFTVYERFLLTLNQVYYTQLKSEYLKNV